MAIEPSNTAIEVVLPAYNEAASLATTVREFYQVVHDEQGFTLGFVVCEDGSIDDTRQVAIELTKELPVRVLSSAERKGYRLAVADGLRSTTTELVGFIDGDGQCDPGDFARLYRAMGSHDIVIGHRLPRSDGLTRRLMSRAFGAVYRSLVDVPVKDPSCPFLIMRRGVFGPVLTDDFGLLSQGFWWEFMARAAAAGLSMVEVPVHHRARPAGKTQNFSARKVPRIAVDNLYGLLLLHRSLTRDTRRAASGSRMVRKWAAPLNLRNGEASTNGQRGQSLRILEIATEAPPRRGGVSRTVGYLTDGLVARGHEVDVIAYPGLPRICLGEVRLSSMCFMAPRLHRSLPRYDIVHVHGATPTLSDVALLVAASARHRPLVVYTHHADLDLGSLKWPSQVYNWLHTQMTRVADATVCSTAVAAQEFSRNRSLNVIPLGIDLGQFASPREKRARLTVMYVGQFRPWKSVPVLLEAAAQVQGVDVIVAGTGPEEQSYRRVTAALASDTEFHIAPSDEELRHLYERAHAMVVPSTARMEAFGLALLEGMAAGCVPIASDLPGVRDVVGPVGFTFEPGNVAALATIIKRLVEDPQLVDTRGRQARARAAQFSRENMVDAYHRLFRKLVAGRKLDLGAAMSAGRQGPGQAPREAAEFNRPH
jgi:glycosyltransferase involved in cell wall biosynthesis